MLPRLRTFALALSVVLAGVSAHATDAGFQTLAVPGTSADKPITVALYYPTQATARAIPMGPFTPHVAPGGPPDASVRGLILLSHGTGGSELAHTTLAEALARHGYLVAALRHPGDNWQDQSLAGTAAFFTERPRQVSRVIDALLASPQWGGRIARDAQGPKVGAVGHSAGGYTVLALGGAVADLNLLLTHCKEAADDAIFCNTGGDRTPTHADRAKFVPPAPVSVADPRVRALAALAPVGEVFTVASLKAMHIPALVMVSEKDTWLPAHYHGEPLKNNIPAVDYRVVPNAVHFAFMNTPGMPIPTPDGDAGKDLPGFDRAAFQARLSQELVAFFDAQLK
jgi:predicted dienelactone hydrolase